MNKINVICKNCGKEYLYHRSDRKGSSRTFCSSCQVARWRRRLKEKAVEYKGGKCSICGYNKTIYALEFHHLIPEQKSFGISEKGLTRGWNKVKKELDKCILLCSNCHRELEYSSETPC